MPYTTPDLVENIDKIQYHHFEGTNCVVCCMAFESGFSAVGFAFKSGPAPFDLETGKAIALKKAKEFAVSLGYQEDIDESSGL